MQNYLEEGRKILERLVDARAVTDKLFGLVAPDALYDRPSPERHRIVYYPYVDAGFRSVLD